jgi:hypothetical protein
VILISISSRTPDLPSLRLVEARSFRIGVEALVAHLPSFLSSSLYFVSSHVPHMCILMISPQLHRKIIIRVVVIPALLPKMCVAVGDLCFLFCPVYSLVSLPCPLIHHPPPIFFLFWDNDVPSTGKSSNSSSSSSCAAGFLSALSGCSPFLGASVTTAFFVAALPWAEPDILAVCEGWW